MTLRIKSFTLDISFFTFAVVSLFVICNLQARFLYCFVAVIIHELGHMVAMKFCGIHISALKISPFDIRIIQSGRYKASFSQDLFVAFSGPLANILSFFIFYYIDIRFSIVSMLLGIFNLLPASSLDGGQILYLSLYRLIGERARTAVDIVTFIISIPVFIIGLMILLRSKYNFSLLFIGLYMFLGVFIRKDKYL